MLKIMSVYGRSVHQDELAEGTASIVEGGCKAISVSDALDAIPLGRFHALHLLRIIVAWAVLAVVNESTPYLFPGMRNEFGLDDAGLAHLASAFPLGCVLGNAAASLAVDWGGRLCTILVVTPVGAFLSF